MSISATGNSSKELEEHNRMIMSMAREGDLIEFPRGVYSHWAVYIGKGKVIELTTTPHPGSSNAATIGTTEGIVREADFMEVAGNSIAKINNEKDKDWEPRPQCEIVATARSLIGYRLYHFLESNCEHFAKLCRYGIADSDQANFLKSLVSLGSSPSVIIGLLAISVVMRSKSGSHSQ